MRRFIKLMLWPVRIVLRFLGKYIQKHDSAAGKRRRLARKHATSVLSELARLGFASRVVVKRGKVKKKRIGYMYPLLMTEQELWLPIDQRTIPVGRTTDELRADPILQSLEDRINAGIRHDYLATGTFCYVINLGGGGTFPEKYSLNSFDMPEDAPALALPFGVDSSGEQVVVDLLDVKHLLIAGATGGGKTTLYHAMITTLISRNDPSSLELWLIDMKRTEFALYRSLMGRKEKAGVVRHIAVDPEDAIEVLGQAFKEIVQRNKLFESMGVTGVKDYEQTTGQKMKRIVLLVDEFAILTTDTTRIGKQTIGTWAKLLMTRIASLGRSSGVSIIIATQMVKKEVIDGMISANFENRIAFSCATWRESNLVVQESDAVGLPNGRAILRVEGKTTEVQTCYVTPAQVKLEIARVAEFGPDGGIGDDDHRRFVRNAKILIDVACRQFDGNFTRSKLLAAEGIRGTISWDTFDEIGRRLERDGILEPARSRFPRKVARAFFGNPNLLDAFYGLLSDETNAEIVRSTPLLDTRSTSHAESVRSDENTMRSTHQDAVNSVIIIDADVECGAHESATHANTAIRDDDYDETPPPPEFEQLFSRLSQPATTTADPPAKPKRKRKKVTDDAATG